MFFSGWNWWRNKDAHHNACRIKGKYFLGHILFTCLSTLVIPIFLLLWHSILWSLSQKYRAVGELGKATDTLDVTGNVVEEKSYGKNHNFMAALVKSEWISHRSRCIKVSTCFFFSRSHHKRGFWGEAEAVYWWNYAGSTSVSQFILLDI